MIEIPLPFAEAAHEPSFQGCIEGGFLKHYGFEQVSFSDDTRFNQQIANGSRLGRKRE